MAATLAAGPQAVLSHSAAADLHGIRQHSGRPEVTVPSDHRIKGITIHRSQIPEDEITTVDGIPVTGISRTLFDLAAKHTQEQVTRAARRAETRRLTDRVALSDLLARYPGRRGTRIIRELVADTTLSAHTRSELEDDFLDFVRRHRLPFPVTNAMIEGKERDAVWPRQRVVVELDSREFHLDLRAFEEDRKRDRVLQRAGWRPVRVTKRHMTVEDAETASDLRAILNLR